MLLANRLINRPLFFYQRRRRKFDFQFKVKKQITGGQKKPPREKKAKQRMDRGAFFRSNKGKTVRTVHRHCYFVLLTRDIRST